MSGKSTAGTQYGKFIVPVWVKKEPVSLQLEGYKNGEVIELLDLSEKSHYVFGRNKELSDIALDHPSISKQNTAVISGTPNGQPGASIVDLGSANGTHVGKKFDSLQAIKPSQPVPLSVGNCIRFGESSRLYMVKATPQQNIPGTFFGKYQVPTWVVSKKEDLKALQLHITKDGNLAKVMDCRTRHHYIFGRNGAHCNVVLEHNSISKQHAVLVQGSPDGSPAGSVATIIDLGASNGTFVSDTVPTTTEAMKAMRRIDPNTPTPVTNGMAIRFGESSRIYALQQEGHESVSSSGDTIGTQHSKNMGQGKFSGLLSTTTVVIKNKPKKPAAKGSPRSNGGAVKAISAAERRRRQQQLLSKSVVMNQKKRMLATGLPKPKPMAVAVAEEVQVSPVQKKAKIQKIISPRELPTSGKESDMHSFLRKK